MASATNGVNSVMGMNVAPSNKMSLGDQYFDGTAASSTAGVVKIPNPAQLSQDVEPTNWQKIQNLSTGQKKTAVAGGKFMLDVINAQSAYQTLKGQAELNIMQARNSAADALQRGRQAQLDAQSIGYEQGNQAVLAAAAQGQDVSGAAVQKVKGSHEAMGVYNGMREEINSMREALGFDMEEVNYDYQVSQAKIQKNNAMIGAALSFGGEYYKNK